MRDRLIKLKRQAINYAQEKADERGGLVCIDDEVDYLLANGVIVPPVEVGGYVWLVFTPKYPANPNDYGKWFMSQDGVQRIILGKKGLSIETWNMGTIPVKELGKKLFLTKEEAKAELEKREVKKNEC